MLIMTTDAGVSRQNNKDLIFLTVLLAAGIVFFELWLAAAGHFNSRDQHLGGAVAYAKGHINLLRPMLLGFTVNGTPTPLEFPVWQASTALLMKSFGLWYGWGNVASLIFFFSSLWALFDLCRRLGSSRIAWWTMVFTLLQPLSWLVGGQAGVDSAAWAFAMWFIYASYRMMSEEKWSWWIVSLCAAGLSSTTKAPFFMTAGLTAFFWLWLHHRRSKRAWFFLVSAGFVGILLFFAWNYHCHRVYAEAEFSTINLDPFDKQGGIDEWYFGTLAYRLHMANWARGIWHLMAYAFAGFAFIFLILVATRLKTSVAAWLWLLAAGCTTLVFPTLIWEHVHYFFVFAPAIAWLCALAAAEIEWRIRDMLPNPTPLRAAILLITLTACLTQALTLVHANALLDPYLTEVGQWIKEHTAPDEKIVVWGMVWGDPFLQADRQGFTGGLNMDDNGWINDPQKLKRLKQLGYTKIVLINPSPFTVALTSVTVHAHKASIQTLVNLHEHLPTVAKNWPVVFDSPQILISQIPDSPSGN
jgi:4-amino-4-deoxy-L-arabinose transferase-like glycosyltransferase